MKQKEKPKYSVGQNVAWMIGNAWKARKRVLLFCVLTAGLDISMNLLQLYVTPEILRRVEQAAPLGQLLLTITLFTGLLFLVSGIREYIRTNTLFARVDVRTRIIGLVSYKCNTTSYSNNLDVRFVRMREKAYNSMGNNRSATEYIWETLTVLLTNVGGLLCYLLVLSSIDPLMLLVIVVTSVASFFAAKRTAAWEYEHREEDEKYVAKLRDIRDKSESIAIAKDIRIFGLEDWLRDIHSGVLNLYWDFICRHGKAHLFSDLADVLLSVARNAIAYGYLLAMALGQGLSASEFLLLFTAVSGFTAWVTGILKQVATLRQESVDLSLLREFLEYPEPFRFEGGKPLPEAEVFELRLENVSYRYPGAEKDTICNMNLTIHPGEKLAIVGLNGAGKTTLVKLLCGFLDPTQGRVLLNGQDVREFNRREYYSLFSAVFQEFSILDVTVAENVSQQAEGMDEERVWDCLEKAGLTKAIQALPQGLGTHVGREVYLDGVLFSGGQTQRLMLARALYKNAPILLLDEPTAALDPIAENDIYQKYDAMTAGKLSVFISHRLASTRFCDRILFLKDGVIGEEGTHESLLRLGGDYAKLFQVQSRYYQEGREF